jgi:hypothetical protein
MEPSTRRSVFAWLTGLFTAAPAAASATAIHPLNQISPEPFWRTADAQLWALAFVKHVRLKPSIATDEGAMIAWFSQAILAGVDERDRHYRACRELEADTAAHVKLWRLEREAINGALARAYCHPSNSHKILDGDLLNAAAMELMKF